MPLAEFRLPVRFLLGALACLSAGCYSWAPVTTANTSPRIRVVAGEGEATWREEAGWDVSRLSGWGKPESLRVESLKAFEAGAHADALEGFLALKDRLGPSDPAGTETEFHIADCYYHLGSYDLAVEHYRRVYREGRPSQAILNSTFDRVYAIGLDYLWGRAGASIIFKFIKYKGAGHGVDLLAGLETGEEGLITEYPYVSFADDALMEIARYYYEDRDYAEAERWYKRVVDEYPRREQFELAEYRLAMSILRQVRGVDYEQDAMVDAERAFRRYLEDNPRGKHAEDARAELRDLSEMQGRSYLNKAKYYLRESQIGAAKIYLKVVLERYTTTAAAREAQEIVRQIDRVEADRA